MKFPGEAAERVARCLLDGGPATARVLADRLGLSAAAARKQLTLLADAGLVQATQRAPYGLEPRRGRGRPSQVFSLTSAGRAACDTAYDDLALEALRFLARRYGPDSVRDFAGSWAEGLVGRMPEGGSVADLAEHLTRAGFAASVEPLTAPAVQLCQHHCPVVDAAAEFPELCEAEGEALSQRLGVHVTRLATLAGGDGVCTTLIPISEPQLAAAQGRTPRKARA